VNVECVGVLFGEADAMIADAEAELGRIDVLQSFDAAGTRCGRPVNGREDIHGDVLGNGADIRYIQAILGHTDLKTTQLYTHVAIRKLKAIHSATHPAKLEREKKELLAALAEEDKDSE
jgi:integrase/recombinase XerD